MMTLEDYKALTPEERMEMRLQAAAQIAAAAGVEVVETPAADMANEREVVSHPVVTRAAHPEAGLVSVGGGRYKVVPDMTGAFDDLVISFVRVPHEQGYKVSKPVKVRKHSAASALTQRRFKKR